MGAEGKKGDRSSRPKSPRQYTSTSELSNSIAVNGHSSPTDSGRGSPLVVGGAKRRRQGASLRRLGRLVLIPPELARARGYRFPSDDATPAQEQALKQLI